MYDTILPDNSEIFATQNQISVQEHNLSPTMDPIHDSLAAVKMISTNGFVFQQSLLRT